MTARRFLIGICLNCIGSGMAWYAAPNGMRILFSTGVLLVAIAGAFVFKE